MRRYVRDPGRAVSASFWSGPPASDGRIACAETPLSTTRWVFAGFARFVTGLTANQRNRATPCSWLEGHPTSFVEPGNYGAGTTMPQESIQIMTNTPRGVL